MAVAFYQTVHCPQLIDTLLHKLAVKSQNVGTCTLWTGPTDRYGYGFHRMVHDGKRLRLQAHRLAFFVAAPAQNLCPRYHVSHLCHNKLCINVMHLSYEKSCVNNARSICRRSGECFGHRGHRRCALDLVNYYVDALLLLLLLFLLLLLLLLTGTGWLFCLVG